MVLDVEFVLIVLPVGFKVHTISTMIWVQTALHSGI